MSSSGVVEALKNEDEWRPSKFVQRRGVWRASRDPAVVARGSRVAGDLQAIAYSDVISRRASGDLVDLGCGTVPTYGMYAASVASVTCVDWPSTLHPSKHIDVEADLREQLPFADRSFDTVVLTDVLEHMPYPDKLFGEVRRLLRPAGVVIVGVPFLYPLHERPHDHHRYTEHRLRLFCTDHGFDAIDLYAYGGPRAVVLDLFAKTLAARRSTAPLASMLPRLARRSPARRTVTPEAFGTSLPMGYVMAARRLE